MKRITICGPDKVIDGIKESAWESRKGVSRYLLDLHKRSLELKEPLPRKSIPEVFEELSELKKAKKISEKSPRSMTGFGGSYSKDRQVGKKT